MNVPPFLRRRGADLLVVGLAVAAQIEIWVTELPGSRPGLSAVAVFSTLSLLARRRHPFVSLAPIVVFAVQALFVGGVPQESELSLLTVALSSWFVGFRVDRRQAVAAAAVIAACIAVVERGSPDTFAAGEVVFVTLLAWTALAAGLVVSERRRHVARLERRAAQLELERAERAREAVADERRRIARELHDVIAHSVSVMTVQAGAARMLLQGAVPERAREPLSAIEETGHEALAEMRRMLGILRSDMSESGLEAKPTLARLDALVERCAQAGLPVELAVEGEPRALAPGVDLAAYRIVQEALTNTIKYAGPARAWVTVRYGSDRVELEISNDGARYESNGGGHGLVGMRERAALYGGEVESGPHPVTGWVVRARLPLEATS